MKKYLSLFILCGIIICSSYAQPIAIDANVSYATFSSPAQNYVEVYLEIKGNTMNFISVDSAHFQGAVEVIILFKQADKIIKFKKYRLNSPLFNQKSIRTLDFVDLKRFPLDNGNYDLEVSFKDLNLTTSAKKYHTILSMQYDEKAIHISDLNPLKYFKPSTETQLPQVKNGYFMEHQINRVYEQESKKMPFYVEIYNTDKVVKEAAIVKYYIERIDSSTTQGMPDFVRYKRLKPAPIHGLFFNFDIAPLQSGEYNLVVETRSRKDVLLAQRKLNFYRKNPYLNLKLEDYTQVDIRNSFVMTLDTTQIDYCLRAATPQIDQYNIVYLRDLMKTKKWYAQRQFLLTYWLTQDAQTPDIPFVKYMTNIAEIDKKFKGTFGYGFETDRGNIYLKYGEPNEVIREESDPGAPPYEIWRYNQLGNQVDIKFLFYNPTLAGNNFDLLHTNKRGELQNPQWERVLYKVDRMTDGNFVDETQTQNSFGRHARQLFDGN